MNHNLKIKRQAFYLVLFAAFMIGVSYASVPLYELFCKVTGYAGTPKISVENSSSQITEKIKVRFDSSTEKNSPLFFEPGTKKITTNIGKNNLIFFKAKNTSQKSVTGTATFNITPLIAAQYFNKIECFCFEEQVFAPGEEVEMPVSFFIDSDIVNDEQIKNIEELTLSYTMYTK